MYIECKAGSLTGSARIGRVTFSKSLRTIYYRGQELRRLPGGGFKATTVERRLVVRPSVRLLSTATEPWRG